LTLLESKQRVTLDEPCLDWIAHNLETFNVTVLELSPSIAFRSNNLREFEHRDPADRIIVATAIDHSLTLLTVDQALIAYPHVKTL
jgi:PIN domain nuclease of toxin-antitoxin system